MGVDFCRQNGYLRSTRDAAVQLRLARACCGVLLNRPGSPPGVEPKSLTRNSTLTQNSGHSQSRPGSGASASRRPRYPAGHRVTLFFCMTMDLTLLLLELGVAFVAFGEP